MTMIELYEPPRKFVWVAGEMPDHQTLKTIAYRYYDMDLIEHDFPNYESLIEELAEKVRDRFCAELEKPHAQDLCDLYCLKAIDLSKRIEPFTAIPYQFFEDFKPHRYKEGFRHLIFSINEDSCSYGMECINNLIDVLGFKVREESDYKNYPMFEKMCKGILDEISKVYVAPALVVKGMMRKMGFESYF